MKSRSIQLLAVILTYISLTFFMTPAHGASSVIGGSTTNVGRIMIISPNPGATQQANGKVLLDTLVGITADGNNTYVIKLGPGVYDFWGIACR